MDSYLVYMLKMKYGFLMQFGFILRLRSQNEIWVSTSFECSICNMDSYFVYNFKMEYGMIHASLTFSTDQMDSYYVKVLKMKYWFILRLRAQYAIWILKLSLACFGFCNPSLFKSWDYLNTFVFTEYAESAGFRGIYRY